ncbi:MAG: PfkB family carbohydrate kinase [Gemmatimonadota bacterium]
MRKLGVVGSLVWDVIHGRDPSETAVEEWGGIAYALGGLDAALPDDWEIVPLIKVGRDLAAAADDFWNTIRHRRTDSRFIEVPTPNNRVVLHYQSRERRCERMSGGVPPWTWAELGPMVRDLDAVYVNFISGFELTLGTAEALRSGFSGPIYGDLHSLLLGMGHDGMRVLQPLPDAPNWFRGFDFIQVNEDELNQLSADPLSLAAAMMGVGVSLLVVTLGERGAVYVAAPGFDGIDLGAAGPAGRETGSAVRTALIPGEPVEALDPTGCGDVFGGTLFATLLGGAPVDPAIRAANNAAARNVTFRGARGLASHLRGELIAP